MYKRRGGGEKGRERSEGREGPDGRVDSLESVVGA